MTTPESPRGVPHTWSILLLSMLVWWPLGSYWQSDDYIALQYVDSWSRTLSDFVGGQYGLRSLVIFYRPCITLSFALEQTLGSAAQPFLSHFTNILAHGISAVCLAAIAARFTTPGKAWATGLLWGLAPSHASSLFWAVGRVDSLTTLWLAASTLFLVQWIEGRRPTRRWALLCFGLALLSKELALVMPGIAVVFGFVMAEPGHRSRAAMRASWPYFIGLLLYFGWRKLVFGELLGGYETELRVQEAATGLAIRVGELLNPLQHSGLALVGLPQSLAWFGFVPLALASWNILRQRRWAWSAAVGALFLGCSVPMLQLWSDTSNPLNLRLYYLPMMALAALLAAGGWRSTLAAVLVCALPLAAVRLDYQESWQRCATLHDGLRSKAGTEPNFVAGLPAVHRHATALEFHLGVDRLTQPPFTATPRRLFALRSLGQHPATWQLPYGADQALPFGNTLAIADLAVEKVTRTPTSADLTLRLQGPADLTLEVLDQLVKNYQARLQGQPTTGTDPVLVLQGVRSKRYRVTIFTASGYLTTFVDDDAPAGQPDGQLQLGMVLLNRLNDLDQQRVGDLLQHATALDLSCRFPILVEADLRPDASDNPREFQATHANTQPLWIRIDRLFANWWP